MVLNSQSIKIGKPDCNLLEKKYDNPIAYSRGISLPRYSWHIIYPSISTGVIRILESARIPRKVAKGIGYISTALVPHILGGLILKKYPIDIVDWEFDLVNRSYYLWDNKLGYLISDLSLECFSHP